MTHNLEIPFPWRSTLRCVPRSCRSRTWCRTGTAPRRSTTSCGPKMTLKILFLLLSIHKKSWIYCSLYFNYRFTVGARADMRSFKMNIFLKDLSEERVVRPLSLWLEMRLIPQSSKTHSLVNARKVMRDQIISMTFTSLAYTKVIQILIFYY